MNLNPKGMTFTRFVIASALGIIGDGKRDPEKALAIAQDRWGLIAPPALAIKAEQAAINTIGGVGAALLNDYGVPASEFMGIVRERSVIGQLVGLKRVPRSTAFLMATGAASASWIGEGKAIPLSAELWERSSINWLKIAAILVQTREFLASADPQAEMQIRAELIAAVAKASDTAFLDPANSGEVDVRPASITNNARTMDLGAADLREGITAMLGAFEGDLSRAVFVGSSRLFGQMSGFPDFPDLGLRGGSILGAPALVGDVPNSGNEFRLVLLDPGSIVFSGSDIPEVDIAKNASIEMLNNPLGQSVADVQPAQMVNLWQNGAVGVKVILDQNWRVVRENSVIVLEGIPIEDGAVS